MSQPDDSKFQKQKSQKEGGGGFIDSTLGKIPKMFKSDKEKVSSSVPVEDNSAKYLEQISQLTAQNTKYEHEIEDLLAERKVLLSQGDHKSE